MLQQEIQTENIITSGGFKETEFKIKNKEFIFDVLSDKIYTNKIGAIIREIISNAVDANIESKSKNKILIHLPTSDEKYLSIRDFGPGMNSERIKVFVSFGDSTKRDSADQIGYFGMGSKSPFAYTDSFYITTWVGGHKNEYMAYIGDDRKRSLMLLNRTKSDSPNGTEVKINIKHEDDNDRFQHEFLSIWGHSLHLFTLNLIDENKYDCSPLNKFHNRKDIYFGRYTFDSFSKFSIMNGNVKYEISIEDISMLDNYYKMYQCQQYFRFFQTNVIVIKFNIGELKLSVSREKIEICEHNARIIEHKVAGLYNEIKKNLNKLWDSCDGNFSKMKNFVNTYKDFGLVNFPILRFEDTIIDYVKTEKDFYKQRENYVINALESSYYFYHVIGDIDKIEGRIRRFFHNNPDDHKFTLIKFSNSKNLEKFQKQYPFIKLIHIRTLLPLSKKIGKRQTKDARVLKAISEHKIGLYAGKASVDEIHQMHFENEKNNKATKKYYVVTAFNTPICNYSDVKKMNSYSFIYKEIHFQKAFEVLFDQKFKIFTFAATYKNYIPKDWIPAEELLPEVIENVDVPQRIYIEILKRYFSSISNNIPIPSHIFDMLFKRYFKLYKKTKCQFEPYHRIFDVMVKKNKKLRNRIAKDFKKLKKYYLHIAKSFPGMFLDTYRNRFLSKLKTEAELSAIKYIKETVK